MLDRFKFTIEDIVMMIGDKRLTIFFPKFYFPAQAGIEDPAGHLPVSEWDHFHGKGESTEF